MQLRPDSACGPSNCHYFKPCVIHVYTAIEATTQLSFGEGSSIVLDDLQCTGLEPTLFDCIHNGRNTHNCDSDEGSGVVCSSGNSFIILRHVTK